MNKTLGWSILVVLLTLTAMGRIVFNDFSGWDDPDNFTLNAQLNPPTLGAALSCWTRPAAGLYVPVTKDAWILIATVARGPDGLAPWPFHLASVLAHLGATVAAFQLLRLLLGAVAPAAVGAMLFGVHPLQTEAVAWASGLKDVLAGMFSLLALQQYVRFAQCERGNSAHYVLASLCFVLAMLSKPVAVVIPVMAYVIDVMILRR